MFSRGYGNDNCYDYWNDKEYKTGWRELCCQGKVFDNSNEEYACVEVPSGQFLISVNEDIVCNNRIHKRIETECCNDHPFPRSDSLQCCGEDYIDPTTDTCCYGQVIHGVGNCCGRHAVYNTLTEICVNGVVHQVPEQEDAWLYGTCRLSDGNIELYHVNNEMCCDSGVIAKESNLRCRGDVLYDITTHVWVHGVGKEAIELGRNSVCGSKTLNPNREVCCYGQVHDVGSADGACCNHMPYSRHNASCCRGVITEGVPEIPGIQECSGQQSYWTSDKISCQNGQVRDKHPSDACCGNEIINTDERICCGGENLKRKGPDDICCGTAILPSRDFCVEGKIVHRDVLEDSYCSLRSDNWPFTIERILTYNSDTYICKGGALVVKKPHHEYCEGARKVYDTRTEICCSNIRVHERSNPWGLERHCCGHAVHHPEEQSCFQDRVFPIPSEFAERCGLSLYNTVTEVCIKDHVYSKTITELTVEMCQENNQLSAFGQTCCQGKPISDSTHKCCDDHVYSIAGMEDPQCCRGRVFDSNAREAVCCEGIWHFTGGVAKTCIGQVAVAADEQLCGDTIYLRADGECCGDGIFDDSTHLCCDGVRLPKEDQGEVCCGTTKYHGGSTDQICCQGTLHEMVPGQGCCGSSLVEQFPENRCLDEHYQVSGALLSRTCDATDFDNQLGTCCGGILYSGEFGACEGFRFARHHPGTREARADDHLSEGIEEKKLYSSVACGDELYNPLTHICCDDTVIEDGRQVCCNGRVQNLTQENENSCCGSTAYNNLTAVCCGERIKQVADIREARDAKGCCRDGQYFDLQTMQCQDGQVQPETEECSLCQDTILSKRAVEELAGQSQHHFNIRITRPLSDQNTIGVKVTPLFRDCPDCPAVLSKKQLRKIKTMVLPEGCNCETFQRQGKYVLLTSGMLQENGQFHLQSNDVLLPPKNGKIVRNVFEQ
ncbi:uncharacterized protein [Apostichopus japonicus]|uniref:uncharacterized protein isoform X2 n=1 Tax=Stichopus japonicus TaxID=307972 RepID=UPI003AB75D00